MREILISCHLTEINISLSEFLEGKGEENYAHKHVHLHRTFFLNIGNLSCCYPIALFRSNIELEFDINTSSIHVRNDCFF